MTNNTSINELLRYEEEVPGTAGRGRAAGLGRTLLITVVASTAILGGLRVAGIAIPIALVVAGVLALIMLRREVRSVAPPGRVRRPPAGESDPDGAYHWPPPDAMRRAVVRWEQRLSWCADEPAAFGDRLQPVLRELVDERLRQRCGTTIGGDPERARALLGEPLWAVLAGTYRRGPGRRELARAVAAMEDLAGTGAPPVASASEARRSHDPGR